MYDYIDFNQEYKYVDKDILWAVYPEVIVNVKSINEKYGELSTMMNFFQLSGVTNGKILILENSARNDRSPQTFVDLISSLNHFEEGRDYIKTIYYNKSIECKKEQRENCLFKNFNKEWLYTRDFPDGAELSYIPEDERNLSKPS